MFCSQCGFQTGQPTGVYSANNNGAPKPTRGKGAWIAGIIVAVMALSAVITLILLASPAAGQVYAGGLIAGDSTHVGGGQIGTDGGTISIEDGALDGFSIDVLEDAFDAAVDFDISTAPIESHEFGDIFTAASPLITIDNGGIFADKPMMLTIPIDKADDEFAMAFFYDEQQRALQPMPLLSLTNTELVTMTQHFSKVVVSKIKKKDIVTFYDTGFKPGVDDFQIRNIGSCIEPQGFCAGQCIAMAFYYLKDELNQGQNLYGRFDNDGIIKTPKYMYDDADAIRLCACIQEDNDFIYYHPSTTLEKYKYLDGVDDTITYYAILYSVMFVKQPHIALISVHDEIAHEDMYKHAVLVYKVTQDAVFIADPNHPGDAARRISFKKDSNGNVEFSDYTSDGDVYNKIGFFGLYAMMDEKKTYGLWREVIDGSPTMGNSAAKYFKKEIVIEVVVDVNENGDYITKPLTDGLVLSEEAIAKLGLAEGNNLKLRIADAEEKEKAQLVLGTTELGEIGDSFTTFQINKGANDIGIYYTIDGEYVNFYRYNVILGDISFAITANPQQIEIGETVSFTVGSRLEAVDLTCAKYIYKWDFGDGQTATVDGNVSNQHIYTSEGTYTAGVSVYNKDGEYVGKAETTVTVTAPEVTPTPSATSASTGQQTIDPALVGTWQQKTGEYIQETYTGDYDYTASYTMTIVFNADGTYSIDDLFINHDTGETTTAHEHGTYKQNENNPTVYNLTSDGDPIFNSIWHFEDGKLTQYGMEYYKIN